MKMVTHLASSAWNSKIEVGDAGKETAREENVHENRAKARERESERACVCAFVCVCGRSANGCNDL